MRLHRHAPLALLATTILVAVILGLPVSARASCAEPATRDDPPCTQEEYRNVPPELWKKAFDKAVQDALTGMGKSQLLRMYQAARARGDFADARWMKNSTTIQQLKYLNEWLAVFQTAEAYHAGDVDELKKILQTTAKGAGLTFTGGVLEGAGIASMPVFGAAVVALEIANISAKELEHQTCLLDIDLEFYDFLDDPALQTEGGRGRINHYLTRYILGGLGNDLAIHRRRFQCYINEVLPPSERFDVSSLWVRNPAQQFVDALPGSERNRQLSVAATVMLDEFNAKRRLEEKRRELRDLMQRPEYKLQLEIFRALDGYPAFQQLLCDAVRAVRGVGAPEVAVVLVIDVSGSMDSHGKLDAAKSAARTTIDRFVARSAVEYAGVTPTPGSSGPEFSILPYSGSCNQRFRATPFSTDGEALKSVIDGLSASGGTPMTTALLQARRHLVLKRSPTSKAGKIVLLTDGQNGCSENPVEAADRIRRRIEDVPVEAGPQGRGPAGSARWLAGLLTPAAAHAAQDVTAQAPATGLPLEPIDTSTPISAEVGSFPIEVSTIGFRVNARQQAALDSIAAAGGGQSLGADDVAQLASAFQTVLGSGPVVGGGGGGGGPIRRSGRGAMTWVLLGLAALGLGLGVAIVAVQRRRPGTATPSRDSGTGSRIDLALAVVNPDGTGREIRLGRAPAVIGRDPDCDLILEDERVSRRHARIEVEDGRLVVTDLGSSHGTAIDGVRVDRAEIRRGAELRLGETILLVR